MDLYIDKENVISLIKGIKGYDSNILQFVGMIKRGNDVYYNFNKTDVDLQNPLWDLWLKLFLGEDKNNTNYFLNSVFPKRPLVLTDLINNPQCIDQIQAAYLLNIKSVENPLKNGLLIGGIGDEEKILEYIWLYYSNSKEVLVNSVSNWEEYCPKLPVTDIVLCDPYYFGNNRTRKDKSKTHRILTMVAKNARRGIGLNIVLIVNRKDSYISGCWDDEVSSIKEYLKEETDNDNIYLTIVAIEDNSKDRFHDRNLITNYYRIKIGSGFQVDNHVKNDVTIQIISHAKEDGYNVSNELLDNQYQKMISKCLRNQCVFGDKSSRFLAF